MIYISGKIGGATLEGVKAKFQKAEDELHALGLKVNNPMKMGFTQSWTSKQILEKRLEVIRTQTTGIYLLSDWDEDMNARREFAEVAHLNLKRSNKIMIYFENAGGLHDVGIDIHDHILTCLQQTELNIQK